MKTFATFSLTTPPVRGITFKRLGIRKSSPLLNVGNFLNGPNFILGKASYQTTICMLSSRTLAVPWVCGWAWESYRLWTHSWSGWLTGWAGWGLPLEHVW